MEIISDEIVEIDGIEYRIIKYSNGAVVKYMNAENPDPEPEPEPEPEPTDEEIMMAEMLLNQAQIIATQSEQDEVLAEILLNQN